MRTTKREGRRERVSGGAPSRGRFLAVASALALSGSITATCSAFVVVPPAAGLTGPFCSCKNVGQVREEEQRNAVYFFKGGVGVPDTS